jgi:membrane protein DedA with SNARE-associated domain
LRDLDRLGGTAVLLGRFSAGVRLFAAAMAGSGRMGYPRFLVYDAAGTVVYVALWLALGHVFGALALERSRIGPVALVLVPLALGVLIGWRLRRRRRHGPATAAGLRRRPARRPGP